MLKRCIAEVMAEEGTIIDADDVLVTTGGQQVIDLVCKTLDRSRRRDHRRGADVPGRGADVLLLPGRGHPDQPRRGRHAHRRARGDARPPRPPRAGGRSSSTPCRRSRTRAGRRCRCRAGGASSRSSASASCSCSRTTPTACCATRATRCRRCYALEGGDFVIYLGTFSKILSPGVRLGWSVGPRPVLEKMNIGKQASDLCSSSLTQLFVAAYFESGRWQDYVHSLREIYRRRRDVMLDSLAECLGPESSLDAPAGRPVHLGDAARLHRHDRPARPRARRARRVRARPRGVPRRPRRAARCG